MKLVMEMIKERLISAKRDVRNVQKLVKHFKNKEPARQLLMK